MSAQQLLRPVHGAIWVISLRRGCTGEQRKIVIRSCFVAHVLPALHASMKDYPALLSVVIEGDRFHEPKARRLAIPRSMLIHVLTPEAVGAVIAVRAMRNGQDIFTAVSAREGFLASDEWHQCLGRGS